MILIAGSTGILGSEICRRLAATGEPIRALVRGTSDPTAIARLRELGVEVVEGDLRDRVSLDAACRDVATVVSTVTAVRSHQAGETIESTDNRGQINLVDAAGEAGVGRFVYVSYSGHIGGADPLTTAKRSVEWRLRSSGMAYVILRPTYFMETWLSPALGFDFANGRVTIYGAGHNKISWISLDDVAEFAVRAVGDANAIAETLELGGPEALSPLEAVAIFEDVVGKRFEVQHVPEDALRAQQQAATDSLQRSFAALMLAYAAGDSIAMDEALRRYPVRLRSVREYASNSVVAA